MGSPMDSNVQERQYFSNEKTQSIHPNTPIREIENHVSPVTYYSSQPSVEARTQSEQYNQQLAMNPYDIHAINRPLSVAQYLPTYPNQQNSSTYSSPVSDTDRSDTELSVKMFPHGNDTSSCVGDQRSTTEGHLVYHQNVQTPQNDPSSVVCELTTNESINITLHQEWLWKKFHDLPNEMIVTKSGRRMFPIIKFDVTGLEPKGMYAIYIQFRQLDNHRWKYVNGEWQQGGKPETQPDILEYRHIKSPHYGEEWTSDPVSFQHIKLTNMGVNRKSVRGREARINSYKEKAKECLKQNVSLVWLNSLHKYMPVIKICSVANETETHVASFSLPVCVFIAVTAYQNENVTTLKVTHNPFAKAFKKESKSEKAAAKRCQRRFGEDQVGPSHQMIFNQTNNIQYHPEMQQLLIYQQQHQQQQQQYHFHQHHHATAVSQNFHMHQHLHFPYSRIPTGNIDFNSQRHNHMVHGSNLHASAQQSMIHPSQPAHHQYNQAKLELPPLLENGATSWKHNHKRISHRKSPHDTSANKIIYPANTSVYSGSSSLAGPSAELYFTDHQITPNSREPGIGGQMSDRRTSLIRSTSRHDSPYYNQIHTPDGNGVINSPNHSPELHKSTNTPVPTQELRCIVNIPPNQSPIIVQEINSTINISTKSSEVPRINTLKESPEICNISLANQSSEMRSINASIQSSEIPAMMNTNPSSRLHDTAVSNQSIDDYRNAQLHSCHPHPTSASGTDFSANHWQHTNYAMNSNWAQESYGAGHQQQLYGDISALSTETDGLQSWKL